MIQINRLYRDGLVYDPNPDDPRELATEDSAVLQVLTENRAAVLETPPEYIEVTVTAAEQEGKTAYWKSARGKLRKANKSQPRKGEKLIYLTPEEEAELD